MLQNEDGTFEGNFKEDRRHGKGVMKFDNEEEEVMEVEFDMGQKHGKCIRRSKKQTVEETYEQGVKNGPYLKKVGDKYEEEGEYVEGYRHGKIRIRKDREVIFYRYENGERMEEIPE